MVRSTELALISKITDPQDRISNIEALDERRRNEENRWFSYQKQISKTYNKKVRPQTFAIGNLMLKVVGHIQKDKCLKITPKWKVSILADSFF